MEIIHVSVNDEAEIEAEKAGCELAPREIRERTKTNFPRFPPTLFSFPSLSHALSRVRLLKRPGAITFKNSEESLLRTIASDTASAKTTKTTTKSGKMSCRKFFPIVSSQLQPDNVRLETCVYNESSRLRDRSEFSSLFFFYYSSIINDIFPIKIYLLS